VVYFGSTKEDCTVAIAPAAPDTIVAPEPEEAELLEALDRRIEEIFRRRQQAKLVGPGGEEVAIPASAFHALKLAVDAMAAGLTITLVPHGKELTSQQAADLLQVSRPYLIEKLLDTGEIPHHRTGRDRRILLDDVLAYRERRAQERRAAARRLTQLSQEVEGGYR
jgi:excisionase family DNA binding protein